MPSCCASSFSHGEAFISSKPERTMTFTSSPPRRRELRQQSIAVLPPPSTITRLPMRSMWPNETLDSQSIPIWMFFAASLRPGRSRSRPRADQRDALAVHFRGALRQPVTYIVLQIGGNALQAADRHGLGLDARALAVRIRGSLFHAPAATCRLTRPVAGPSQDAGKDIR